MTKTARVASAIVSAAALAGLAWASQVPMPAQHQHDGVLRLAWSARPERVEHCQQQSETELAKLPQHMRQAVVCTGETASYQLTVALNGVRAFEQIVRGGGLRHDRQLYVFRDLPVARGQTDVDVQFTRIDTTAPNEATRDDSDSAASGVKEGQDAAGMDPTRRAREADERLREHEAAVPAVLRFTRRLTIDAGRVVLVKYDADAKQLLAVTDDSP